MASPARMAALRALERCRRGGAWSSDALSSAIENMVEDRRDAALVSSLGMGVLRNTALLDFYIGQYSSVPLRKIEPKVLDILRISAFQILFMDRVPNSAAVSEAVEICNQSGLKRASGFVNAVLRRVSEKSSALPEIPGKGTAAYLSVKYSHPEWLVDELISGLGMEETEAFLGACNAEPPVFAAVNTLKHAPEELSALGEKHPFLTGCIELKGGNVRDLPELKNGSLYIQDPAARIAVMAAAPEAGMSVLDACAAPGGKSFAAALEMRGKGRILSCDIHGKKLGRIRDGAERLGIDIIEAREMDAREPSPELQNAFDVVLADAPCSGWGVIRRKPEIRYKEREEISALPALQGDILNGVSGCVKSGGVLLYSTCTVRKEENERVAEAFLRAHGDFAPEDFLLPGALSSEGGMLTLWPQRHGTDGFFICKMRKA